MSSKHPVASASFSREVMAVKPYTSIPAARLVGVTAHFSDMSQLPKLLA